MDITKSESNADTVIQQTNNVDITNSDSNTNTDKNNKMEIKDKSDTTDNTDQNQNQKTKSNKNGKGKGKVKNKSKSSRSGLTFSVGRTARYLRKSRISSRMSGGAPIYMAAVLEYLTAEILSVAGDAAKKDHKHRITPRHIHLGVGYDGDLKELLRNVTMPQSGSLPHIENALLPVTKTKTSSSMVKSANKTPVNKTLVTTKMSSTKTTHVAKFKTQPKKLTSSNSTTTSTTTNNTLPVLKNHIMQHQTTEILK
jgi:histone H2A